MKSDQRGWIGVFAALLAASLAAGGCAKDRDLEDYQRDKLSEELTKLQAVAGVYRGRAVSRETGKFLAGVTLDLRADTRTVSPSEQRPILRGSVTLHGQENATLTFSEASYDPNTGSLKASQRMTSGYDVDVYGELRDGRLRGGLEVFGHSAQGADIDLVRDGLLPTEAPSAGVADDLLRAPWNFRGPRRVSTPPTPDDDVLMRISADVFTTEGRLSQRLMPVRRVRVVLDFGRSVQAYFPNADWDRRTGTLAGKTNYSNNGYNYELTLECNEPAGGIGTGRRFDCRYESTYGGVLLNDVRFERLP